MRTLLLLGWTLWGLLRAPAIRCPQVTRFKAAQGPRPKVQRPCGNIVGSWAPATHPQGRPGVSDAPLAQLDRASGYEPGGRRFESCRARHSSLTARRAAPCKPAGSASPAAHADRVLQGAPLLIDIRHPTSGLRRRLSGTKTPGPRRRAISKPFPTKHLQPRGATRVARRLGFARLS